MKLNRYKQAFILISILFLFSNPSFPKGLNGPEEFNGEKISSSKDSKKEILGILKKPLLSLLNAGLTIYQYGVSDLTGSNCSMYPSCSHYSREVLKKHGSIIGLMMTTDRLIHEAEELERGQIVKRNEKYYVSDPVEDNDFWWSNEKK